MQKSLPEVRSLKFYVPPVAYANREWSELPGSLSNQHVYLLATKREMVTPTPLQCSTIVNGDDLVGRMLGPKLGKMQRTVWT